MARNFSGCFGAQNRKIHTELFIEIFSDSWDSQSPRLRFLGALCGGTSSMTFMGLDRLTFTFIAAPGLFFKTLPSSANRAVSLKV